MYILKSNMVLLIQSVRTNEILFLYEQKCFGLFLTTKKHVFFICACIFFRFKLTNCISVCNKYKNTINLLCNIILVTFSIRGLAKLLQKAPEVSYSGDLPQSALVRKSKGPLSPIPPKNAQKEEIAPGKSHSR